MISLRRCYFPLTNKNGPPQWTSCISLSLLCLLVALLSQQTTSVRSFTQQPSSKASSALFSSSNIRFMGKGPNAIVRPGSVLVAPKDEFHHFYRQAAIFIYAMGEDEDYDNQFVIRGAIIDHPTPFTLGEMAESSLLEGIKENPMADNLIYRGGDKGGDNVFMLHNQQAIGGGDMVGTSGIYQGGLQEALDACQKGDAQASDFKFFFNFCQFTEEELESMLDDDPWISVEVPPEFVLNADFDRGDCWKQLRNALRAESDAVQPEPEDPYDT